MDKNNRCIGVMDACIYWLIIVLPFFIAIAPAPKNIIIGLLLAAFLIKKGLKREGLFKADTLNLPLFFLLVVTCLSVMNSISLKDTLKGGILKLIEHIFIFNIMRQEIKDKKHLRKILFFMALGVMLASTNAIFQVATGRDFIRGYAPILNLDLVRATASFKDANILGIYLSAFVPVLLGLTLYYFKSAKRIMVALISILGLAGIALTYSRPTLLAIYGVFVFFAIARRSKAMIACIIIFTLVSPFLLPKSVKTWAKDVEYNPLRFMCNDDRIAVYRNSLLMIKAHPLIGVGANTFMKSYRFYKEYPEYRNIITLDEMKAHNNFLHMAGEIGLLGLSIFSWFLFVLFKESSGMYRALKDRYLKVASLSAIACLIAFLINGLTESSLYYSVVSALFWYLAGLSVSFNKITDADK